VAPVADVHQTHISVFPERLNLDKMQLIVILLITWELQNKIKQGVQP
jgi:hypothetical protein